jgi:hypothetical protein
MLQARLVAPIAKLVAKSSCGEWAPILGHKKGQIARWACVDDALQLWQDWQFKLNRVAVPVFVLSELERAAAQMGMTSGLLREGVTTGLKSPDSTGGFRAFFMAMDAPGSSRRAFFLTVPSQATVKSLSSPFDHVLDRIGAVFQASPVEQSCEG